MSCKIQLKQLRSHIVDAIRWVVDDNEYINNVDKYVTVYIANEFDATLGPIIERLGLAKYIVVIDSLPDTDEFMKIVDKLNAMSSDCPKWKPYATTDGWFALSNGFALIVLTNT